MGFTRSRPSTYAQEKIVAKRSVLFQGISKNVNLVERADENTDFVVVMVKVVESYLGQMACAQRTQFLQIGSC